MYGEGPSVLWRHCGIPFWNSEVLRSNWKNYTVWLITPQKSYLVFIQLWSTLWSFCKCTALVGPCQQHLLVRIDRLLMATINVHGYTDRSYSPQIESSYFRLISWEWHLWNCVFFSIYRDHCSLSSGGALVIGSRDRYPRRPGYAEGYVEGMFYPVPKVHLASLLRVPGPI